VRTPASDQPRQRTRGNLIHVTTSLGIGAAPPLSLLARFGLLVVVVGCHAAVFQALVHYEPTPILDAETGRIEIALVAAEPRGEQSELESVALDQSRTSAVEGAQLE